jgi:hypothetical protein
LAVLQRLLYAKGDLASVNGVAFLAAPRGERCRAPVPHGHGKTTTFAAGLRLGGLTAPLVLDGPMTGSSFLA